MPSPVERETRCAFCVTALIAVVFGTLFMFTMLGLVTQLIADTTYTLVDPRIDFETRGT